MNRGKNELLQFLGGLLMLAAGLFIFCNKVTVSTLTGGYGMLSFGRTGFAMPTGLVIVPLIIGIVWMFASDGSFASKIFTTIAVIFIIAIVIMNTRITLDTMKLYDWILILVLIFGGGALVAKIAFANRGYDDDAPRRRGHKKYNGGSYNTTTGSTASSIDSQLEQMKKDMK